MGYTTAAPADHVSAGGVFERPVAAEVRAFYDRYPYPPPVDSLEQYRRVWREPDRRRADYHLFWPAESFRDDFSILVAGCGTSQAAKYALRWPAAKVTAIDVSATSIRCTEELRRTHGLMNLKVHQLPIERVHELGACFDQVVCTGVLHHLEDPDAGLAALREVLKPGGAMHLMVYAPYGRTGVYMLQAFCKCLGIRATEAGIRDLIVALRGLPRGHPLERLLRAAPDFRQEPALADALLNPQDRAYSVPQLFEFIEGAGLRFGRWVRQAPYSPQCGVMAHLPLTSRLRSLTMVEQYTAAELFRGTMVRHSVVAYRADDAADRGHVRFVDDVCLGYVPVLAPDTIRIHDRLPPGAAAVLINQTHTDCDIVLAIEALEERLIDATDGKRCIGAIVEDSLPGNPARFDIGRRFFERLWLHDHIAIGTA